MSRHPRRLQELLASRATQGLDASEARRLQRLLDAVPERDDDSFDQSVAAIYLSQAPEAEPPASLRARLVRLAAAWDADLPPRP